MQRIIGTYSIDTVTIEYSITGEKGKPILVMHGGHSNCYEEFGYDALVKNGFSIITPSRAGYGKTSEAIGDSLSQACYYYIALLDYLNIDTCHVLAMSAGGPSALYLASHYPHRVKTLTLQSAVTKQWHTPEDAIYKVAQFLFHPLTEKGTWKLTSSVSNLFPQFIFKQMAPSFSKLSYEHIKDDMTHDDINAVREMNNRQRSGKGFLIDLTQTGNLTTEELKAISAPTLIIHSENDAAVPLDHAYSAKRLIANSELHILKSWGHLIWIGKESKRMQDNLAHFLNHHSIKT